MSDINEIIIDSVRESHCLYDKTNVNFRNVLKKKEIWNKISAKLKKIYGVDMSGEAVEKRWMSLRDMFSREHRKKELRSSSSVFIATKEWDRYRSMSFLLPHIVHRRIFASPLVNQSDASKSPPQEYATTIVDHDYDCKLDKSVEDNIFMKEEIIPDSYVNDDIFERPHTSYTSTSNDASCSPPSTSFSLMGPTFKSIEAAVPETHKFPKHHKLNHHSIDNNIENSLTVMLKAVEDLCSLLNDTKPKDGYTIALAEAFQAVPSETRTECLVECLKIIRKYEKR